MRGRVAATVLLAVGTLALSGAAATAAPWFPLASGGMNVSDQIGLARTPDGVLHVAWARSGYDVVSSSITPDGRVGAPVTVVSGWASAADPVLVASGGALRAFFAGAATTETTDPRFGIDLATSTDGGATWVAEPRAIATGDFAAARTPAAIAVGDSFLQAWYAGSETVVHAGLDGAVPAGRGYGDGIDQGLAVNTAGKAMVAWCDGLSTVGGVFAQGVDPASGAAAGEVWRMPDTGYCDAAARTKIVALGKRVYVAAPDATRRRVLLWWVGFKSTTTLAGGQSFKQHVALTATSDGRLWAGWQDSGTGKLMFTRSNPGAERWGAVVSVGLPAGQRVSQLDVDAGRGRLGAVVRTSDDNNLVALLTTQVQPGLTLTVAGRRSGGRRVLRVLDAGDPVAGAVISGAGATARTDNHGWAIVVPGRGPHVVTASGPEYAPARITLR